MATVAASSTSRMPGLVTLLRPHQWPVKNAFILTPVPFLLQRQDWTGFYALGLLFVAFCLAASSVYVYNDMRDVEDDRRHPAKQYRPLPSGSVTTRQAVVILGVLTAGALLFASGAHWSSLLWIGAYLILSHAYSLRLKHVPYAEFLVVGSLFGIRVLAGFQAASLFNDTAVAWGIVAGGLATGVVLGKRISEFKTPHKALSRPVLARYSDLSLIRCYKITMTVTVVAYLVASTMLTLPMAATTLLVVYGLYRFWGIMSDKHTPDLHPQHVLLRDGRLRCVAGLFVALFTTAIVL